MNRIGFLPGLVLAGVLAIPSISSAEEADSEKAAANEQGYRMEQKIEYKEVRHPYCKIVPEKRRRWVYCTKPDYYCLPACPLHGPCRKNGCCGCDSCPSCKGPYCRPQLWKKEIEWECGVNCRVEYIKEKVPVLVWRKVPNSSKKKETAKQGPASGSPRITGAEAEPLPSPRPLGADGAREPAKKE